MLLQYNNMATKSLKRAREVEEEEIEVEVTIEEKRKRPEPDEGELECRQSMREDAFAYIKALRANDEMFCIKLAGWCLENKPWGGQQIQALSANLGKLENTDMLTVMDMMLNLFLENAEGPTAEDAGALMFAVATNTDFSEEIRKTITAGFTPNNIRRLGLALFPDNKSLAHRLIMAKSTHMDKCETPGQLLGNVKYMALDKASKKGGANPLRSKK